MAYPFYRIGFWIRETGIALDKVGCFFQGNSAYAEEVVRHRTLLNLFNRKPAVSEAVFIAPNASLVGDVSVGKGSSVWYGSVLRGDVGRISVGSNTSIQDGTVVRTASGQLGRSIADADVSTSIGDNVTVGHGVSIHAATIEDGAMIGIGATLLEGCKVGKGAIVAAGAVLCPGTIVPSGEIWAGNPATKHRAMKDGEHSYLPKLAAAYVELGAQHSRAAPKTLEDLVEADMEIMKS